MLPNEFFTIAGIEREAILSKIGRNAPCHCGSGTKYKKCCLVREREQERKTMPESPYKAVKISDIGTSNPTMARLGLGLMELIDFSSLSEESSHSVMENGLEMAKMIVEAEKVAKPILCEIQAIVDAISKNGVPQNSDGKPYIPGKCYKLAESQKFLILSDKILDLFFQSINLIWHCEFNRRQLHKFIDFIHNKLGQDHILYKLLADDIFWLSELNHLIDLTGDGFHKKVTDFQVAEGGPDGKFMVILPSFQNGLEIASHLKVLNYNIFTFIEEILVFSIVEFIDDRLTVHDLPENLRDKAAPVRFKVGVKPGVDLKTFKGHPKLNKIYRSGQHFYHLKDKLREGRFGRVRPIIQSDFQGKKTVAVGNTLYFGGWKTFVDFLFDYIKIKFEKEWWLTEAAKPDGSCSLVMEWARKSSKFQTENSIKKGDLFSIDPNGPMHAYLMLAYDIFVLEDNQKLQGSLIGRMQQPDRTNFWGARYEATVASTFIKAGFDIEYEDESDGSERHPEFIAVHRDTGEKIAVEAKKRNRQTVPQNESEIKLKITSLIGNAVGKFKEIPFVLFLELDLPPIDGNPLEKPWIKELLESHGRAGVRDTDGKDFLNMIIFTNYPTEHPQDEKTYPGRTYIVSQSQAPKINVKNPIHLRQIVSAAERNGKIPSWFEE